MAAVEYPDATTGDPSSGQEDTYTYNALGDITSMTDRNGTTHQYTYDVLDRLTSDTVTTLGSGVDGTIQGIGYAYDSQGNQYLVTNYNGEGAIVNQVEDVYNGLNPSGKGAFQGDDTARRGGHHLSGVREEDHVRYSRDVLRPPLVRFLQRYFG